jgi:hypothetical protein
MKPQIIIPALFCLLLFMSPATAQNATGALSGVVRDQNGDVIEGVEVKVLNVATSQTREVATGRDGAFYVPVLPPGTYSVTLFRDGFAPLEITGVALGVGEERAFRVELKIGTVREQVTVVGEAAAVNDAPGAVTTLERKFTDSLPLNGRSLQRAFNLLPGAVVVPTLNGGQFSVNGQRANANYFMVDGAGGNIGVSQTNRPGQATAGSLPPVTATGGTQGLITTDALEAVYVQTSTYSAQYGRQPGAQVSYISRAGANRFTGGLFEYHRPRRLEANSWFANRFNQPNAALRLNQFGGSLGGPVWRGKAFFFLAYEGQRADLPAAGSENIFYVPPASLRANAHPHLRPVLNAYPLPNLPGIRTPAGGNNDLGVDYEGFIRPAVTPHTVNAGSLRLDYSLSGQASVFARYHHAPSHIETRLLSMLTRRDFNSRTLTVGGSWVREGTWTGDWRLNWSRVDGRGETGLDDFGGAAPLAASAVFPRFASLANYSATLAFPSGSENLFVGPVTRQAQRQINATGSLSRLLGRHTLQFGADYRYLFPRYEPAGEVGYSFNRFNDGTAFAAARFYQPFTLIFHNFSAFFDDTWRAKPRLTLNWGWRWEFVPPPRATGGRSLQAAENLDNPAQLRAAPAGTPLWQTCYGNVAPRFGVAWQISQKPGRESAIRGGAGLFYDLGTGVVGRLAASDLNTRLSFGGFAVPFPPTGTQLLPPSQNLNPPFAGEFFSRDLRLPYSAQWNVTFQQTLGANVFTAAYVASAGRRLLRVTTIPAPNAQFLNVNVTNNSAASSYHSLQAQFQRRLARGLQAIGSYTLAHSLDTTSDDSIPVFTAGQPADHDRGPSDFDVRHNLSGGLSYDLPQIRGPRFFRFLLQDWTLAALFKAQTAPPVNVLILRAIGNNSYEYRPDLLPGAELYLRDANAPGGRRLNPAAFTAAAATRQGSLGRNALRGLGLWEADAALRRSFNLPKKASLQISAELYNALNHPNFAAPNNLLGAVSGGMLFRNETFGQSSGTLRNALSANGATPFFQIGGPRALQVSVRLSF